jgi:death-on-curing protein
VRVAHLDLVDYLAIAAEVTGLDVGILSRVALLDLADSALHAPAAGWGEEELYPDFVDKAAVLVVRLAKNHPMPDGDKRAAWSL